MSSTTSRRRRVPPRRPSKRTNDRRAHTSNPLNTSWMRRTPPRRSSSSCRSNFSRQNVTPSVSMSIGGRRPARARSRFPPNRCSSTNHPSSIPGRWQFCSNFRFHGTNHCRRTLTSFPFHSANASSNCWTDAISSAGRRPPNSPASFMRPRLIFHILSRSTSISFHWATSLSSLFQDFPIFFKTRYLPFFRHHSSSLGTACFAATSTRRRRQL